MDAADRHLNREELTQALRSADARLAGLVLEGPRHSSPNGVIYRGHGSGLAFPLAVKSCRSREDAGLAHAALESLAQAAGASGAPAPVGLYCEGRVLVMEWVEAPSLRAQVLDPRTPKAVFSDRLRQAAGWLRWLHSVDAGPAGTVDVESKLQAGLSHLSKPDLRIDDRAIAAARDLLFDTAGSLAAHPTPQVLNHGDFKPENILVSDGRAVGVDIARRYRTCGDDDVVHFLNHLELLADLPKGFRHRARMPGYVGEFLAAYYGPDGELAHATAGSACIMRSASGSTTPSPRRPPSPGAITPTVCAAWSGAPPETSRPTSSVMILKFGALTAPDFRI